MRAVVRGTYYPNPDGSVRSHIIRKYCRVGSRVELVSDPTNPQEPNGMAIYLVVRRFFIPRRFQIGYLKETTAARIASGSKRSGKVVKIHAPFGDNSPTVTIKIHV
jgi:hypothetical protein